MITQIFRLLTMIMNIASTSCIKTLLESSDYSKKFKLFETIKNLSVFLETKGRK